MRLCLTRVAIQLPALPQGSVAMGGNAIDRLLHERLSSEAQGAVGDSVTLDSFPTALQTALQHLDEEHCAARKQEGQERAERVDFGEEDDCSDGRIGPARVHMVRRPKGDEAMHMDDDGLLLRSHGNFASMRTNACVYKGKWMYEAVLHTDGILQIGWATITCSFTNEEGVGDSPDSFSFDGKRQRRWNLSHKRYGEVWSRGDVIGACIDLNLGHIRFYRNGKDLGLAFDNVRTRGPLLAYFPTVSLSRGESCELNFGEYPFMYPVSGYAPLQQGAGEVVRRAALHTSLIEGCLPSLHALWLPEAADEQEEMQEVPSSMDLDSVVLAFCTIFESLGPMLAQHRAAAVPLVDLLLKSGDDLVGQFFVIAESCLEPFEFCAMVKSIMRYVGLRATTASFLRGCGPLQYARLASTMLRLPVVMLALHDSSDTIYTLLERIFSFCQPNESDLKAYAPVVYWEELENMEPDFFSQYAKPEHVLAVAGDLKQNLATVQQYSKELHERVASVQTVLTELLGWYLDEKPQLALSWLMHIQKANDGKNRNVPPPTLSSPSLLGNLFFALCTCLRPAFENLDPTEFPKELLLQPSLRFMSDHPLVGGTYSHLRKEKPVEGLPEDLEAAYRQRMDKKERVTYLLIDNVLRLFDNGVSEVLYKMADRRAITKSAKGELTRLHDTYKSTRQLSAHGQRTLKQLFPTVQVSLRATVWDEANLFQPRHQLPLSRFVAYGGSVINHFQSIPGPLYCYVPEHYLVGVCKAFHALRKNPLYPQGTPELERSMKVFVEFSLMHFDDERLVSPDVRELFLQSISYLMQQARFVRYFEASEMARSCLIPKLLAVFDVRFWVHVGNVFISVWNGTSFGVHQASSTASPIFQQLFCDCCSNNAALTGKYLNQLFNFLNTAATEFRVAVKKLRERPTTNLRSKCVVLFELLSKMLMLLEVVAKNIPRVLLEEALNVSRLSELILQLLQTLSDHGSSGEDFKEFLRLAATAEKPEESVQMTVLGPIAGILTSLQAAHSQGAHAANVCDRLAEIAGQQTVDLMTQLGTFDWTKANKAVTVVDQEHLQAFLAAMASATTKQEAASQCEDMDEDEENLCTICYTSAMDTVFVPCQHKSCSQCITRHLLDNTRCFFCNTPVESTQPLQ